MPLLNDEKSKHRQEMVADELLQTLGSDEDTIYKAMKYSLMSDGKRLRPLLLMSAADAVGGDGDKYIKAACAIEMIHNYSLIHDDLPAMDDDDYRRGKPTNHRVYGEGMAILAGDALQTLAFETILKQPDVSAEALVTVTRELAEACGAAGLVGGQAIDLESEGKLIDMDTLRKMHTGKTGALFRAAIRIGAILADADEGQLAALTTFADKFGLAYQITDDILDVTGDEVATGKPGGSDVRNNKSTYVTLTSLAEARFLARSAVSEATDALASFDNKAAFLRDITSQILKRDR